MDTQHTNDLDVIFDDARRPGEVSAPLDQNQSERRETPRSEQAELPRENPSDLRSDFPLERTTSAPRELSLAQRIDEGFVNPGWQPAQWAARLLQLAERCERLHPDVAADYQQWAANVLMRERR